MDPYAFRFEPVFLVAGAVAAFLYARAARGERPPWWRVALFSAGLLLVVGALNSPLESLLYRLLLIHLLQNVMVADWAPPLLLLGLTPAGFTCVAQSPADTKVDLSTVPDTTIQSEDYAEVCRHFHTKLLKKGPGSGTGLYGH